MVQDLDSDEDDTHVVGTESERVDGSNVGATAALEITKQICAAVQKSEADTLEGRSHGEGIARDSSVGVATPLVGAAVSDSTKTAERREKNEKTKRSEQKGTKNYSIDYSKWDRLAAELSDSDDSTLTDDFVQRLSDPENDADGASGVDSGSGGGMETRSAFCSDGNDGTGDIIGGCNNASKSSATSSGGFNESASGSSGGSSNAGRPRVQVTDYVESTTQGGGEASGSVGGSTGGGHAAIGGAQRTAAGSSIAGAEPGAPPPAPPRSKVGNWNERSAAGSSTTPTWSGSAGENNGSSGSDVRGAVGGSVGSGGTGCGISGKVTPTGTIRSSSFSSSGSKSPVPPPPCSGAKALTPAGPSPAPAIALPVKSTMTWVITDYSARRHDRAPMYSPPHVDASQCKWRFIFYPNGEKSDNWISLFIEVPEAEALPFGWRRTASFTITLFNRMQPSKSYNRSDAHVFKSVGGDVSWGWPHFIECDRLAADGFLRGDGLEVAADISLEAVSTEIEDRDLCGYLCAACAVGDLDNVKHCLYRNAPINDLYKSNAPLHSVCMATEAYPAVLNVLLDAGADIDLVNGDNESGLLLAAYYGHSVIVEELLIRGALTDVGPSKNGLCALGAAAQQGEVGAARLLMKAGAPLAGMGIGCCAPLKQALQLKRWECAKVLVETGCPVAPPSQNDEDYLLFAARHGTADIVTSLIEHGADANVTDKNGDTALAILIDRNLPSAALKLAREHSASVPRCSRDRKKVQRAKLLLALEEKKLAKASREQRATEEECSVRNVSKVGAGGGSSHKGGNGGAKGKRRKAGGDSEQASCGSTVVVSTEPLTADELAAQLMAEEEAEEEKKKKKASKNKKKKDKKKKEKQAKKAVEDARKAEEDRAQKERERKAEEERERERKARAAEADKARKAEALRLAKEDAERRKRVERERERERKRQEKEAAEKRRQEKLRLEADKREKAARAAHAKKERLAAEKIAKQQARDAERARQQAAAAQKQMQKQQQQLQKQKQQQSQKHSLRNPNNRSAQDVAARSLQGKTGTIGAGTVGATDKQTDSKEKNGSSKAGQPPQKSVSRGGRSHNTELRTAVATDAPLIVASAAVSAASGLNEAGSDEQSRTHGKVTKVFGGTHGYCFVNYKIYCARSVVEAFSVWPPNEGDSVTVRAVRDATRNNWKAVEFSVLESTRGDGAADVSVESESVDSSPQRQHEAAHALRNLCAGEGGSLAMSSDMGLPTKIIDACADAVIIKSALKSAGGLSAFVNRHPQILRIQRSVGNKRLLVAVRQEGDRAVDRAKTTIATPPATSTPSSQEHQSEQQPEPQLQPMQQLQPPQSKQTQKVVAGSNRDFSYSQNAPSTTVATPATPAGAQVSESPPQVSPPIVPPLGTGAGSFVPLGGNPPVSSVVSSPAVQSSASTTTGGGKGRTASSRLSIFASLRDEDEGEGERISPRGDLGGMPSLSALGLTADTFAFSSAGTEVPTADLFSDIFGSSSGRNLPVSDNPNALSSQSQTQQQQKVNRREMQQQQQQQQTQQGQQIAPQHQQQHHPQTLVVPMQPQPHTHAYPQQHRFHQQPRPVMSNGGVVMQHTVAHGMNGVPTQQHHQGYQQHGQHQGYQQQGHHVGHHRGNVPQQQVPHQAHQNWGYAQHHHQQQQWGHPHLPQQGSSQMVHGGSGVGVLSGAPPRPPPDIATASMHQQQQRGGSKSWAQATARSLAGEPMPTQWGGGK